MTTILARADISAIGPIDGTGARHPEGSYVLIHILPDGREPQRFRISRGGAEQLEAEIHAALADAPDAGPDDNERAERIAYCIARGIDPFEIVADGGCEAWMAVTEHNLRAAAAALADAPGEKT